MKEEILKGIIDCICEDLVKDSPLSILSNVNELDDICKKLFISEDKIELKNFYVGLSVTLKMVAHAIARLYDKLN